MSIKRLAIAYVVPSLFYQRCRYLRQAGASRFRSGSRTCKRLPGWRTAGDGDYCAGQVGVREERF